MNLSGCDKEYQTIGMMIGQDGVDEGNNNIIACFSLLLKSFIIEKSKQQYHK